MTGKEMLETKFSGEVTVPTSDYAKNLVKLLARSVKHGRPSVFVKEWAEHNPPEAPVKGKFRWEGAERLFILFKAFGHNPKQGDFVFPQLWTYRPKQDVANRKHNASAVKYRAELAARAKAEAARGKRKQKHRKERKHRRFWGGK